MECQQELMAHGIPREAISVSLTGDFQRDNHLQWLQMRRELESRDSKQALSPQSDSFPVAPPNLDGMADELPPLRVASSNVDLEPQDVLFGRGRPTTDHDGNIRFHQIVEAFASKYESGNKTSKTAITHAVRRIVAESGGRFLKPGKEGG